MESYVPKKAIDKARAADPSYLDMPRVIYRNPKPVQYELITALLEEIDEIRATHLRKKIVITLFINPWPTGEDFLKLDTEQRIKEALLHKLQNEGFIESLQIYSDSIRDDNSSYETDAIFASFKVVPIKLLPHLRKLEETTSKTLLMGKNGVTVPELSLGSKHLVYQNKEVLLSGGMRRIFLSLLETVEKTETGFKGKPIKIVDLKKIGKYKNVESTRTNLTKLRRKLNTRVCKGIEISVEGTNENEQVLEIKYVPTNRT
jgi:hypothetical protein